MIVYVSKEVSAKAANKLNERKCIKERFFEPEIKKKRKDV